MGMAMRAILPLAALLSIGVAQPGAAACLGSGIGAYCIDPYTGQSWSAADEYIAATAVDDGKQARARQTRITKSPSATAGSTTGESSGSSGGSGVTTVLQPTPQSTNAAVVTPSGTGGAVVEGGGSGGAVVLGHTGSAGATVCGQDAGC
jgi:hypothetical protein